MKMRFFSHFPLKQRNSLWSDFKGTKIEERHGIVIEMILWTLEGVKQSFSNTTSTMNLHCIKFDQFQFLPSDSSCRGPWAWRASSSTPCFSPSPSSSSSTSSSSSPSPRVPATTEELEYGVTCLVWSSHLLAWPCGHGIQWLKLNQTVVKLARTLILTVV